MNRVAYYLEVIRILSEATLSGRTNLVAGKRSEFRDRGTRDGQEFLDRALAGDLAGFSAETPLFFLDFLQELTESEVGSLLEALAAAKIDFVSVVPLRYSDRLLDDETNEHKTVQAKDWWEREVRKRFPVFREIAAFEEWDVAFATFAIPEAVRDRIDRINAPSKVLKELERLRLKAMLWRRLRRGDLDERSGVLAELEGKSVSVVGNARSLGEKAFAKQIDANDIVVRFNRMPIISRRSHGYRTDWLATSIPLEPDFVARNGVKRVLWMSSQRRKMGIRMLAAQKLYIHPRSDIARLARQAGVERPSTGLMFIDLLAHSACKSVELYGFDFYKSRSLSGHQTADATPHVFDREEAFVAGLLAKDPRFKLCR